MMANDPLVDPKNKIISGIANIQEDFEDLYQNAPCGYLSHLPDGTIVRINDTALRWLGYNREDVIYQKKITDFFDIGGKIFYQTHHFPMLRMHGQVKELSYDLLNADGARQPVLISANAVNDEKNKMTLARTTIFDISERKKYEAQLFRAKEKAELAEKKFRFMAESIPALVWTMEPDGELDYYSRKFYDCTGKDFGNDAVSRQNWGELLHPRDRERTYQALDYALRNAVEYKIEHRIRHKDGGYKWMLSHAIPFRDDSGDILKWFGTTIDIDEEKRSKVAIQKARELLQLVINTVPAIIAYVDREERFLFANSMYERWYGKKNTEVVGATIEDVLGEQAYAVAKPHIDRALLGEAVTYENKLINKNNEERIVRVAFNPDRQGKRVNGFVVFVNDITKQKEFESVLETKVKDRTIELEKVNRELLRSNQDLEQFAFVASHDLKEPLRMISAYSQLISRMVQNKPPDLEDYFGFMLEGVKRMRSLIDGLLEYSRIGQGDLYFEYVDMDAVVKEVLAQLKFTIEERKAGIIVEPLPAIQGSRSLISHLFQNLLSNALKFSRPDVSPEIHISGHVQENTASFSVADNGIGIDPAYANKIFNIFQRLNSRDAYAGNGIGLALCKKIVNLHGGKIWIEGNLPHGTIFRFTLK